MSKQKELEQLLRKEILPEINEFIDDLFEIIASKKETPEIKEELKEIQEMKSDFLAILNEINNDEISQEECEEIIEDLKDMKQE